MISDHEKELMDERDRRNREIESERQAWENFREEQREYREDMRIWESMSDEERRYANQLAMRDDAIFHAQIGFVGICIAIFVLLPELDVIFRAGACIILAGLFYVAALPLGRVIRALVRSAFLGGGCWLIAELAWSYSPVLMRLVDRPIFGACVTSVGVAAGVLIEIVRGTIFEAARPSMPLLAPPIQKLILFFVMLFGALFLSMMEDNRKSLNKKAKAEAILPVELQIAKKIDRSMAKRLRTPAEFSLTFSPDGILVRAALAKSSGNNELDRDLLRAAGSFERIKIRSQGERTELKATVTNRLISRSGKSPSG